MAALDAWTGALSASGVDEEELSRRRAILEEFCEFAGSTPDDLVEGCVDRDRGQIVVKQRKRVEALIDEFAARSSATGDKRASTNQANVVRSFFIHNGVRLIAPRAPWL